jgi:hypothetical protein
MPFREFVKELSGKRIEGQLLKTVAISLLSSLIVVGVLYFVSLKNIDNFVPKYGLALFILIIVSSLLLAALQQIRSYRQFACMTGMMIGMTAGMISGFMGGYLIGFTNGMFMGSMFGILLGSVLGIWLGSCCGIMGFMEGIMAGFMGGLMGAMTAVMMINDNLLLATILISLVSIVILISLNYMVYLEMKSNNLKVKIDQTSTVIITVIIMVLAVGVIAFGPRSGIVG